MFVVVDNTHVVVEDCGSSGRGRRGSRNSSSNKGGRGIRGSIGTCVLVSACMYDTRGR